MKITTINLDDELYNYLKSKSKNVSRYIKTLIKEKMGTEEDRIKILERDIELKKREVDNIKNKVKEKEQEKGLMIKKLTEGQKRELRESLEILNKEGGNIYFEGRYNRYKNLFEQITKEEFNTLLKLFNNNK